MNKNIVLLLVFLLLIIGSLGVYANYQVQQNKLKQEQFLMKQKQEAAAQQKVSMQQQKEEQMQAQLDQQMKEGIVILTPVNNATESGTAKFEEVNGKVKVTIAMTNYPTGVGQLAHIHVGACPNAGKAVYPLTNVINGSSVTLINASMSALAKQLPLAVNVHKSLQDHAAVSCGDIKSNILQTSTMEHVSDIPSATATPVSAKNTSVTPMLTPTPSKAVGY